MKRAVALFTTTCFLVTQVLIPNGMSAAELFSQSLRVTTTPQETKWLQGWGSQNSFELTIPPELGTIQTVLPGSEKLVVHLQTAHGHYEAQKNIQAILKHLHSNFGITNVLVEGSASELAPNRLRRFPDDDALNLKVADKLMHDGIVKGSELYLLEHNDAKGYGVEKLPSYIENGQAFLKTLRQKKKAEKFLAQLREQIERLSNPYLSPALRDLLKHQKDHDAGQLPFLSWIDYLKENAKVNSKTDVSDPRYQLDWPMLFRLSKLREIEEKLDLTLFDKQKENFIRALDQVDAKLREAVTQLLRQPLSDHHLPHPQTSYLFEAMANALPRGYDFAAYPQVNLFMGHLILKSELDANRLMSEIEELSRKVANDLSETDEAKRVLLNLRHYRLLKKLFALELTPDEFEQTSESMRPSVLVKSFLDINRDNRVQNVTFGSFAELDELFDFAMNFYHGAKQRDQEMLVRVEQRLTEHDLDKVVIITGGFHAEPFQQHFDQRGYQYALISPAMTKVGNRQKYTRSAFLKGLRFTQKETWEDPFITDPGLVLSQAIVARMESVALALSEARVPRKPSIADDFRSVDSDPLELRTRIHHPTPRGVQRGPSSHQLAVSLRTSSAEGRLDGTALIRFISNIEPKGGMEIQTLTLNRQLVERNAVDIYMLYPARGSESLEERVEVESGWRGRIIYVPINLPTSVAPKEWRDDSMQLTLRKRVRNLIVNMYDRLTEAFPFLREVIQSWFLLPDNLEKAKKRPLVKGPAQVMSNIVDEFSNKLDSVLERVGDKKKLFVLHTSGKEFGGFLYMNIANVVMKKELPRTFVYHSGKEDAGYNWLRRLMRYIPVGNAVSTAGFEKYMGRDSLGNGIDTKKFDPSVANRERYRQKLGLSEDTKLILVSTRIVPRKGHAYLFKALKKFKERNPGQKFAVVLAGKMRLVGKDKERFDRSIKENGLSEHIEMLGHVDYEDMPDVYAAADLDIHPSVAEGFPRAVLEAQAMSLPVIATDVGGTRDAIIHGKTGYLIRSGSVNQLVRRMEELLIHHPERLKQFSRASRKHIEGKYDLFSHSVRHAKFYRSGMEGFPTRLDIMTDARNIAEPQVVAAKSETRAENKKDKKKKKKDKAKKKGKRLKTLEELLTLQIGDVIQVYRPHVKVNLALHTVRGRTMIASGTASINYRSGPTEYTTHISLEDLDSKKIVVRLVKRAEDQSRSELRSATENVQEVIRRMSQFEEPYYDEVGQQQQSFRGAGAEIPVTASSETRSEKPESQIGELLEKIRDEESGRWRTKIDRSFSGLLSRLPAGRLFLFLFLPLAIAQLFSADLVSLIETESVKKAVSLVLMVTILPILEEITYRWLLQRKILKPHFSTGDALLIGSLLFGVIHIIQHPLNFMIVTVFLSNLLGGYFFGALYQMTKDFRVPISIHMANNLFALGGMILVQEKIMVGLGAGMVGIAGVFTLATFVLSIRWMSTLWGEKSSEVVDKHTGYLSGGTKEEKSKALWWLGAIETGESVEVIDNFIQNTEEEELQRVALRTLVRMDIPEAEKVLQKYADEDNQTEALSETRMLVKGWADFPAKLRSLIGDDDGVGRIYLENFQGSTRTLRPRIPFYRYPDASRPEDDEVDYDIHVEKRIIDFLVGQEIIQDKHFPLQLREDWQSHSLTILANADKDDNPYAQSETRLPDENVNLNITESNYQKLREIAESLRPNNVLPQDTGFEETSLAEDLDGGIGNELMGITELVAMFLKPSTSERSRQRFTALLREQAISLQEGFDLVLEFLHEFQTQQPGQFVVPQAIIERVKAHRSTSGMAHALLGYVGYVSEERKQFILENPEAAESAKEADEKNKEDAAELERLMQDHQDWFEQLEEQFRQGKGEFIETLSEMLQAQSETRKGFLDFYFKTKKFEQDGKLYWKFGIRGFQKRFSRFIGAPDLPPYQADAEPEVVKDRLEKIIEFGKLKEVIHLTTFLTSLFVIPMSIFVAFFAAPPISFMGAVAAIVLIPTSLIYGLYPAMLNRYTRALATKRMRSVDLEILKKVHRARYEENKKIPVYAWLDDIDGNITDLKHSDVPEDIIEEYLADLRAGKERGLVSGRAEDISDELHAKGIHDIEEVAVRIRRVLEANPEDRKYVKYLKLYPENGTYVSWREWDETAEKFVNHEVDLAKRYLDHVSDDYEFSDADGEDLYELAGAYLERQGFPNPFKFVEQKRYAIAAWINDEEHGWDLKERSQKANEMAVLLQKFLEETPQYQNFEVVATSVTVDIGIKEINKYLAVRYLRDEYNLEENQIASFDDKASELGNGYPLTERPQGYSTFEYDPKSQHQVALALALDLTGVEARRVVHEELDFRAIAASETRFSQVQYDQVHSFATQGIIPGNQVPGNLAGETSIDQMLHAQLDFITPELFMNITGAIFLRPPDNSEERIRKRVEGSLIGVNPSQNVDSVLGVMVEPILYHVLPELAKQHSNDPQVMIQKFHQAVHDRLQNVIVVVQTYDSEDKFMQENDMIVEPGLTAGEGPNVAKRGEPVSAEKLKFWFVPENLVPLVEQVKSDVQGEFEIIPVPEGEEPVKVRWNPEVIAVPPAFQQAFENFYLNHVEGQHVKAAFKYGFRVHLDDETAASETRGGLVSEDELSEKDLIQIQDLFGNENAIKMIELGHYNAEILIEEARRNPTKNYLGIEPLEWPQSDLENLPPNLVLIHGRAENVLSKLGFKVEEVRIVFEDPSLSEEKSIAGNRERLEAIMNVLDQNGHFSVVSENRDYVNSLLERLNELGYQGQKKQWRKGRLKTISEKTKIRIERSHHFRNEVKNDPRFKWIYSVNAARSETRGKAEQILSDLGFGPADPRDNQFPVRVYQEIQKQGKTTNAEHAALFGYFWAIYSGMNYRFRPSLRDTIIRGYKTLLPNVVQGHIDGYTIRTLRQANDLTKSDEKFAWKVFHDKFPDQSNRRYYLVHSPVIRKTALEAGEDEMIRVLDLGSGPTGAALHELKEDPEIGEKIDAIGMDIAIEPDQDDGITLIEGNFLLPESYRSIDSESVDIIYSNEALQYSHMLEDLHDLLQRVVWTLKPGGLFVIQHEKLADWEQPVRDFIDAQNLPFNLEREGAGPIVLRKYAASETRVSYLFRQVEVGDELGRFKLPEERALEPNLVANRKRHISLNWQEVDGVNFGELQVYLDHEQQWVMQFRFGEEPEMAFESADPETASEHLAYLKRTSKLKPGSSARSIQTAKPFVASLIEHPVVLNEFKENLGFWRGFLEYFEGEFPNLIQQIRQTQVREMSPEAVSLLIREYVERAVREAKSNEEIVDILDEDDIHNDGDAIFDRISELDALISSDFMELVQRSRVSLKQVVDTVYFRLGGRYSVYAGDGDLTPDQFREVASSYSEENVAFRRVAVERDPELEETTIYLALRHDNGNEILLFVESEQSEINGNLYDHDSRTDRSIYPFHDDLKSILAYFGSNIDVLNEFYDHPNLWRELLENDAIPPKWRNTIQASLDAGTAQSETRIAGYKPDEADGKIAQVVTEYLLLISISIDDQVGQLEKFVHGENLLTYLRGMNFTGEEVTRGVSIADEAYQSKEWADDLSDGDIMFGMAEYLWRRYQPKGLDSYFHFDDQDGESPGDEAAQSETRVVLDEPIENLHDLGLPHNVAQILVSHLGKHPDESTLRELLARYPNAEALKGRIPAFDGRLGRSRLQKLNTFIMSAGEQRIPGVYLPQSERPNQIELWDPADLNSFHHKRANPGELTLSVIRKLIGHEKLYTLQAVVERMDGLDQLFFEQNEIDLIRAALTYHGLITPKSETRMTSEALLDNVLTDLDLSIIQGRVIKRIVFSDLKEEQRIRFLRATESVAESLKDVKSPSYTLDIINAIFGNLVRKPKRQEEFLVDLETFAKALQGPSYSKEMKRWIEYSDQIFSDQNFYFVEDEIEELPAKSVNMDHVSSLSPINLSKATNYGKTPIVLNFYGEWIMNVPFLLKEQSYVRIAALVEVLPLGSVYIPPVWRSDWIRELELLGFRRAPHEGREVLVKRESLNKRTLIRRLKLSQLSTAGVYEAAILNPNLDIVSLNTEAERILDGRYPTSVLLRRFLELSQFELDVTFRKRAGSEIPNYRDKKIKLGRQLTRRPDFLQVIRENLGVGKMIHQYDPFVSYALAYLFNSMMDVNVEDKAFLFEMGEVLRELPTRPDIEDYLDTVKEKLDRHLRSETRVDLSDLREGLAEIILRKFVEIDDSEGIGREAQEMVGALRFSTGEFFLGSYGLVLNEQALSGFKPVFEAVMSENGVAQVEINGDLLYQWSLDLASGREELSELIRRTGQLGASEQYLRPTVEKGGISRPAYSLSRDQTRYAYAYTQKSQSETRVIPLALPMKSFTLKIRQSALPMSWWSRGRLYLESALRSIGIQPAFAETDPKPERKIIDYRHMFSTEAETYHDVLKFAQANPGLEYKLLLQGNQSQVDALRDSLIEYAEANSDIGFYPSGNLKIELAARYVMNSLNREFENPEQPTAFLSTNSDLLPETNQWKGVILARGSSGNADIQYLTATLLDAELLKLTTDELRSLVVSGEDLAGDRWDDLLARLATRERVRAAA